MANLLSRLRDLHQVDVEIAKLSRRLEDVPIKLREHQAEVDRVRGRLEEKKNEILEHSTHRDRLELDLAATEDEIAKLQVQLNSVKTNNEYQALTRQIASRQADKERLEEQILEIMDRLEELRREEGGREAEVREAEADFARVAAAYDQKAAALRSEIDAKRTEREQALRDVPGDALSTYDKILAKTGGTAMAPVRNQICQECNMAVTTHDLTRILNGENLVLCRHCSHILYLSER